MKKFFIKVKSLVLNLLNKYYYKPKLAKLKEKQKSDEQEALEKEFKDKFGFKHDEVISILKRANALKPSFINDESNANIGYFNEKLIEGRKQINANKKLIPPMFYEPLIVDIHNEFVDTKNGDSIEILKKKDAQEVANGFIEQEKRMQFNSLPKKKKDRILKVLGLRY